MYGELEVTSPNLTHANTNDAKIKNTIDNWYNTYLSKYSNYLADAGFCNDRSLSSGVGHSSSVTDYGVVNRINGQPRQPQFACPQTQDLFTTASSNKGNKALTNPVGLLTLDEAMYAGTLSSSQTGDSKNYLKTGYYYWLMTPASYNGSQANVYYIANNGTFMISKVNNVHAVRPVINLKSDVLILGGNGKANDPYIVKTN